MSLNWDPYTAAGAGRITQFGQKSAPSASIQNGSSAAQLVHVGLADGGRILAQYSNGDQVVVGQLALASIRNPDTLIAAGNNNFALSARTATPSIGVPGTGGRGTIVGGSIEASTVDIAQRVHQPDRLPARVRGELAGGDHGRHIEPGHYQLNPLGCR